VGLIYKAVNNINGKIYVGKTTLPLCQRIKKHQAFGSRPVGVFQLSLAKYGFTNFSWEILEEIPDYMLDKVEIQWIAKLNSTNETIGYNRSIGGDGGRKEFKDSEETRRKKSLGMLGNKNSVGHRVNPMTEGHRKAISKAMIGKKHRQPMSESHRQKISNLRKGIKLTEEQKKKISLGVKRYLQNCAKVHCPLSEVEIGPA